MFPITKGEGNSISLYERETERDFRKGVSLRGAYALSFSFLPLPLPRAQEFKRGRQPPLSILSPSPWQGEGD